MNVEPALELVHARFTHMAASRPRDVTASESPMRDSGPSLGPRHAAHPLAAPRRGSTASHPLSFVRLFLHGGAGGGRGELGFSGVESYGGRGGGPAPVCRLAGARRGSQLPSEHGAPPLACTASAVSSRYGLQWGKELGGEMSWASGRSSARPLCALW